MSRHLYDLVKLKAYSVDDIALNNRSLFNSVVEHRRLFIGLKDFDYSTLSPRTIKILPPDILMAKIEEDYKKMQTMIYGKPLSFSEIISELRQLNERINKIEWV